MLQADDIRHIALALPEAYEAPHFEATSFRVGKKIFCTLGERGPGMVLKFDLEDQHNLSQGDPGHIRPVSGYWGRSGWTEVDFAAMDVGHAANLIRMSWAGVAPKRLLK